MGFGGAGDGDRGAGSSGGRGIGDADRAVGVDCDLAQGVAVGGGAHGAAAVTIVGQCQKVVVLIESQGGDVVGESIDIDVADNAIGTGECFGAGHRIDGHEPVDAGLRVDGVDLAQRIDRQSVERIAGGRDGAELVDGVLVIERGHAVETAGGIETPDRRD